MITGQTSWTVNVIYPYFFSFFHYFIYLKKISGFVYIAHNVSWVETTAFSST